MSLKYFRNKTDNSNLNLSDWQPKYVYVLCRHIILFFTFFLKKITTRITKLPYFNSVIIIFVLQFENDQVRSKRYK